MGIKHDPDLRKALVSGKYFTFTTVRHPFDRLISAYRDRILDGCTWQSQHFVPQIFDLAEKFYTFEDIYDETTNCTKLQPSFKEFIDYIIETPHTPDPHWMSYSRVSIFIFCIIYTV